VCSFDAIYDQWQQSSSTVIVSTLVQLMRLVDACLKLRRTRHCLSWRESLTIRLMAQQRPAKPLQLRHINPIDTATVPMGGCQTWQTTKCSRLGPNRCQALFTLPLLMLNLGGLQFQEGGNKGSASVAGSIYRPPESFVCSGSPLLDVIDGGAVADGDLGELALGYLDR
jgi:hypothetical protein